MLLERADIFVKEGTETDFAAAMQERGIPILSGAEGVKSVKFGRGVETSDKFILLVEWESLDAHKAFAKTPSFLTFREVVGPFSRGGGSMEHFEFG